MADEPKKPTTDDTVRINIPLPKELHKRLRLQSVQESVDMKDLIPRLLREALDSRPESGNKGGSVTCRA